MWHAAVLQMVVFFNDYSLILPEHATPKFYWNWAYQKMLKDANLIITRAENPNVSWTEDEKTQLWQRLNFSELIHTIF